MGVDTMCILEFSSALSSSLEAVVFLFDFVV